MTKKTFSNESSNTSGGTDKTMDRGGFPASLKKNSPNNNPNLDSYSQEQVHTGARSGVQKGLGCSGMEKVLPA